jgi:hypothetical protein
VKNILRNLLLGEISSNGDKSKTKSFARHNLYCQSRGASQVKTAAQTKNHLKVIKMKKDGREIYGAVA